MPKFIQKGDYGATHVNGEWIILNANQYTVTKINEIGGYCWSLLNEVQTVESLTTALADQFSSDVPINDIKRDVEEFLHTLERCGLIQNAD